MSWTLNAEVFFDQSRGRQAFAIRKVSEIRTAKGWQDFTGTAEIILPRNVKDFAKIAAHKIFDLGDPVSIRFGYGEGVMPLEFEGYISDVTDGVPYKIKCEDEMFRLKRGNITVSKKECTLKELLQEISGGSQTICPNVYLGPQRYVDMAPVQILENLKKELGIYTYFAGKTLHAMDGHSQKAGTISILLEKEAESEKIEKKSMADERVLVRFKSLQRDGRYITYETGDVNGTVQARDWPYLSQAEVKERAERILELQKSLKSKGSITLFGVPRAEQGMQLELKSLFYENLNGTYPIKKVTKEFGKTGIRQVLEL